MRSPRTIAGLAFAFAALALSGCFSVVHDSSYPPQSPPNDEVAPSNLKPVDRAPVANPEQVGVHIELTPLESGGPTKTQFLVQAAVTDKYGRPRRARRVDWLVEGVGEVVEVDDSGYVPARGHKIDNRYGVSYTDYKEHKVKMDDGREITIEAGRTWCIVTSAEEGDMRLTVSAPDGGEGETKKVLVTRHWCDAEWRFPPATAAPSGSKPLLNTQIIRATDRQPLANYKVRYRILDGQSAVLLPANGTLADVTSDSDGDARVAITELAVQPGSTRIGIEIIRPEPNGPGVVVGHGETRLDWQAPLLALTVSAPQTSMIGADIPIVATVSNPSQVPTQPVIVRMPIPQGLQYVSSEPAGQAVGAQVVWQFSAIPEGASQSLRVSFRAPTAGVVTASAFAQASDGLRADGQATTRVSNPALRVGIDGARSVAPGESVPLEVSIANTGGGPATNVKIRAEFDTALTHESAVRSLELSIGTLQAGESQTVPLMLTAAQPGKPAIHVVATGDGDLHADAARSVAIVQRALQLHLTGQPTRYVNRPSSWNVRVVNAGDAPLTNTSVHVRLPSELRFQSATNNGQLAGGEVVWTIGDLRAGEARDMQFMATPLAATGETSITGFASADKTPPETAEATYEVMGMPVLRAEIVPPTEPIAAGGKGIVAIRVTNQGTLAARNVVVAAVAPAPFLKPQFGGGPTVGRVQGDRLEFAPVTRIEAGQTITFQVDVAGAQAGDGRLRVEVKSESSPTPLTIEDPIRVTQPAAPGRLPMKP